MIDLLMWVLNGESTLPYCLRSIKETIPSEVVGQKIVIDAHSTDGTCEICKNFGWRVMDAKQVGIPFQANQALKLVKSEFFASFEQDIVLHPYWFKYIMKHFGDENVSVAQGVRVAVNPVLGAIDLYKIGHQFGYSSLDNTIYRTEVIRELGGFNVGLLSSLDKELQQRVREDGYTWIVDRSLISLHLHSSLWKELKHQYHIALLSHGMDSTYANLKRFAFSPFRGFDIAVKQKRPETILYYPLLRLAKLKGVLCH